MDLVDDGRLSSLLAAAVAGCTPAVSAPARACCRMLSPVGRAPGRRSPSANAFTANALALSTKWGGGLLGARGSGDGASSAGEASEMGDDSQPSTTAAPSSPRASADTIDVVMRSDDGRLSSSLETPPAAGAGATAACRCASTGASPGLNKANISMSEDCAFGAGRGFEVLKADAKPAAGALLNSSAFFFVVREARGSLCDTPGGPDTFPSLRPRDDDQPLVTVEPSKHESWEPRSAACGPATLGRA